VTKEEAKWVGFVGCEISEKTYSPIWNGRDLTDLPRGLMVIDLFGLTPDECGEVFGRLPSTFLLP